MYRRGRTRGRVTFWSIVNRLVPSNCLQRTWSQYHTLGSPPRAGQQWALHRFIVIVGIIRTDA